jgi:hypothetical protein
MQDGQSGADSHVWVALATQLLLGRHEEAFTTCSVGPVAVDAVVLHGNVDNVGAGLQWVLVTSCAEDTWRREKQAGHFGLVTTMTVGAGFGGRVRMTRLEYLGHTRVTSGAELGLLGREQWPMV